jgi:hypothetical protein
MALDAFRWAMFSSRVRVQLPTGGSVEDNRVGFTHERATHNGVCKNEDSASPEWNYWAFEQ